jgi:hypothetical protein
MAGFKAISSYISLLVWSDPIHAIHDDPIHDPGAGEADDDGNHHQCLSSYFQQLLIPPSSVLLPDDSINRLFWAEKHCFKTEKGLSFCPIPIPFRHPAWSDLRSSEEHAQSALLAFLNGFAHSGKLQGSHGLLFIILFHDFFHSKEGFCWMAVQH